MKTSAPAALLGFLACTLLAAMAAGCDEAISADGAPSGPGASMIFVDGVQEFQQKVLQSNRPVLVEFFKASCPTCVLQEAWLDELAEEYQGRVVFARMRIRDAAMNPTCPEIMERYQLFWVPTEMLIVNGQEKQRWVFNHLKGEFREAINDALLQQSSANQQKVAATPQPAVPVRQGSALTDARLTP
jgi:thioredoxin 1